MLFEVTRTSLWGDEKPYDKCVPIKLTRVETRTLKTPEEFDEKFSKREGRWLERCWYSQTVCRKLQYAFQIA